MTSLEVWPTRAQFRPGEPVGLVVCVTSGPPGARLALTVRVYAVGELLASVDDHVEVDADGQARITLPVGIDAAAHTNPATAGAVGYAIEATITSETPTKTEARATTAFDIAHHWSAAPRYGFLSDFGPDEAPAESERRANVMLRLHLNVIQFYDWMASHHTFFAADEEFTDPLGRRVSHAVVRRKVDLAHERGMAALAYGALYGAEADFSDAHPDWLLYDGARRRLSLADLFVLQDFTTASPWRTWIIDQYRQTLTRLGFDGIHIDQYGFPKRALSYASGAWAEIDVGECLPGFVEAAATEVLAVRAGGGSIFNCVNAWPLHAMTNVSADAATYIEVWEPHTTYRDLAELVRQARAVRPDKQVILAAYLRPFHPDRERSPGALNAYRLAAAAIHASGGFHLVAGEGDAMLAEAYYPHYGRLDGNELGVVIRYLDFVVRNTAILHAAPGPDIAWTHVGPTNDAIVLDHPSLGGYGAGARPNSLWVVGREVGGLTCLNLINMRGLKTDEWNTDQPDPPLILDGVRVRARVSSGIDGVWWDTPDDDHGVGRPLPYEVVVEPTGRFLVFDIPRIAYWSAVWWRTREAAA